MRPLTRLVLCLCAGLVLVAAAPARGAKSPKEPEVGAEAPPLAGLRDLGGRILSLRAWRANPARKQPGKILLLSFFATWCKPCKKELPLLIGYADKMKARGVDVLLVGFREEDAPLQAFVKERGLEVTVTNDRYGKTAESYGVDSLPRLYVIGRDGKLLGKIHGEHDDLDKLLSDIVDPHLPPPPSPPALAAPAASPPPPQRLEQ